MCTYMGRSGSLELGCLDQQIMSPAVGMMETDPFYSCYRWMDSLPLNDGWL